MNPQSSGIPPQRHIYSVSRLNREVRVALEDCFPPLWVEGEISNLARPASGHIYFSLKDEYAQVRCAMFRSQRQRLRFRPDDGQQVLVRARVSLYEGRGEFQLVLEHMEPSGEGALRQAFEQLKQKLAAEGLFDPMHKRPLPRFPMHIGIITSPTGAAIRDILSVLRRRFPAILATIYPVQVQGTEAADQAIAAIATANARADCDLLVLARGGGSLEDLMSFNDERLARAIFASNIPVITGIGHEIDFTIADLVADYRAPTPSAAAEQLSPDQFELLHRLDGLESRITGGLARVLHQSQTRLARLETRLSRLHPGQRVLQRQQRIDELEQRIFNAWKIKLHETHEALQTLGTRLHLLTPSHRLEKLEIILHSYRQQLIKGIQASLNSKAQRLVQATQKLDALSPLATLQRGYSISLLLPTREVLTVADDAKPGDRMETRLRQGGLISIVESRFKE